MTDNKIQVASDGALTVPAHVAIPFITGDGIGAEITPAMQQVIDKAVQVAYGQNEALFGKRCRQGSTPLIRWALICPTTH